MATMLSVRMDAGKRDRFMALARKKGYSIEAAINLIVDEVLRGELPLPKKEG